MSTRRKPPTIREKLSAEIEAARAREAALIEAGDHLAALVGRPVRVGCVCTRNVAASCLALDDWAKAKGK